MTATGAVLTNVLSASATSFLRSSSCEPQVRLVLDGGSEVLLNVSGRCHMCRPSRIADGPVPWCLNRYKVFTGTGRTVDMSSW